VFHKVPWIDLHTVLFLLFVQIISVFVFSSLLVKAIDRADVHPYVFYPWDLNSI